jgi:hypothetical protein
MPALEKGKDTKALNPCLMIAFHNAGDPTHFMFQKGP